MKKDDDSRMTGRSDRPVRPKIDMEGSVTEGMFRCDGDILLPGHVRKKHAACMDVDAEAASCKACAHCSKEEQSPERRQKGVFSCFFHASFSPG